MYTENGDWVHDVRVGDLVIDIYRKEDKATGQVFFDYRTSRWFMKDDDWHKNPYCQQRDIGDHIRALVDVQDWIKGQYRRLRMDKER